MNIISNTASVRLFLVIRMAEGVAILKIRVPTVIHVFNDIHN